MYVYTYVFLKFEFFFKIRFFIQNLIFLFQWQRRALQLVFYISFYLSRRTKEHMNDLWILDQDSWRWDQIIPFGAPAPNPRLDPTLEL